MLIHQGVTRHAILVLHGLCGSPLEMGSIPKALQRLGHTVALSEIAGYNNSDPKQCTPWEDWIEQADIELAELMKDHDSVSVCGLSMGATLALALAARHDTIQSVVLLSPILRYDGWSVPPLQLTLLRIAYFFGLRNWVWREKEPYGICNPELRRRVARAVEKGEVSEVGAATLSARHLYQALKLMNHVRENLPNVRSDLLIMHAVDDETAAPRNAEEIIERVASETRKALWLGDCYHIITVDNEREVVTNETVRFIENTLSRHRGDQLHRKARSRQSLRDRR